MKKTRHLFDAIRNMLAFCVYTKKNPDLEPMIMMGHEFTATGASLLFANLYKEFRHKGYAVVILTANINEIDRVLHAYDGTDTFIIRLPFGQRIRRGILCILKVVGVKRVLCNTVISGVFAADFREIGFRTVYLIHEMKASLSILHAKALARDIAAYGDVVVFPADTVLKSFREYARVDDFGGKVICIPQGYYKDKPNVTDREKNRRHLREKYALPVDASVILGAGAINFGKGVDLLLLLMKEIQEYSLGQETHLMWLGSINEQDPYYQWLQTQMIEMGISDRIHFIGFVGNDIEYTEILSGADVYVLSSREDSFPSTVIEALYCSLPVVAFWGSGGVPDYLKATGQGVCVPMADIKALREVVLKMIQKRDAFANKHTIQKAEEDFSFDTYVNKLEDLLQGRIV